MDFTFNLSDLEATKNLAIQMAKTSRIGTVLSLKGDLGTGKTTFVRYFIEYLDKNNKYEVTSPTFNMLLQYDFDEFPVYHFDLYRLEKTNDAYEIGLEDALKHGVAIVEWPEIIEDILPKDRIEISFEFGKNENERCVKVNFDENSLAVTNNKESEYV